MVTPAAKREAVAHLFCVGHERAAGVQNDRLRTDDGEISVPPARRRRTAGTAAKSGPCAAALRLPAPARPAATGGLHGEPQTPVPALSRGAPYGPPPRRS